MPLTQSEQRDFYFTSFLLSPPIYSFLKMNIIYICSFAQQLCNAYRRQTSHSGGRGSSDRRLCFASQAAWRRWSASIQSPPWPCPASLSYLTEVKTYVRTVPRGSRRYCSSGDLASPSACNHLREISAALPQFRKSLCFCASDPLEDAEESTTQSVTNSAAELLKQGAGNAPPFRHSLEIDTVTKPWVVSHLEMSTSKLFPILLLPLLTESQVGIFSAVTRVSFSFSFFLAVGVLPQPATCGTCARWKWSRSPACRLCRRPPPWLWAPTLRRPPPWSTSKSPRRESPSPTTRGSECSARCSCRW